MNASIALKLASACLAVPLYCMASAGAHAQVYLQDSTLVGSGGTLTATRVPVAIAGRTYYYDVTIPFSVATTGKLQVGSAVVVTAPVLLVSNFETGTYVWSSNTNYQLTLSGPGVIGSGGPTAWTIDTAVGKSSPCIANATFYTGPISANPLAARLQKAGITSPDYSYGIDRSTGCAGWGQAGIIAVAQVGNQLTVMSYTDSYGTDHNLPQATLSFTLTQ